MASCGMQWSLLVAFTICAPCAWSLAIAKDGDLSLLWEDNLKDVDYDENYRLTVTSGNDTINSTLAQGGHYREISITLYAFNETFIIDLKLNTFLYAVNFTQKSVTESGEIYHDVNHAEEHCHYLGIVRNRDFSAAAVSTCNGISGYFAVGNSSYYIHPQGIELGGPHKVFRNKEGTPNKRNNFENDEIKYEMPNVTTEDQKERRKFRWEFKWPQDDEKMKVVEVYFACDYEHYLRYQTVSAATERVKTIVNMASSLFNPLNIYLVLVGVEVWTSSHLIDVDLNDSTLTLRNWNQYREEKISPIHPNDNAVLLTVWTFPGGVIGKAYVGAMCSTSRSSSFVRDVNLPANAATTFAHEMGHNFGIEHDPTNSSDPCSCPNVPGRCVMYPAGGHDNLHAKWSPCSKDQLAKWLQTGEDKCLHNIPQTVFQPDSGTCGNGIVEHCEQCDCGNASSEVCNRECCNPINCQLTPSAKCAYGKCCDIPKCQLKPKLTECRAKNGECDLAELCDGVNPRCPRDTHMSDGTDCVNLTAAYCYNGRCQSHQSQCELLWGPGSKESNQVCFEKLNIRGDETGNCGLDRLQNPPVDIPCDPSDVLCGKLHCEDNLKTLGYLLNEVRTLTSVTMSEGGCHSVKYQLEPNMTDPGLVPDGAQCSSGKMCLNQKCVPVETARESCSSKCSENEVCNNLGQCQPISPKK